jgi:hypothetical protein
MPIPTTMCPPDARIISVNTWREEAPSALGANAFSKAFDRGCAPMIAA